MRGFTLFAIALAILVGFSPAQAQTSAAPGYARERMYLGFSMLPNFTLDGVTFDGNTYYVEEGGDETFILPKLEKKTMPRIVAGFRSRPFALEFSYEHARHAGTFLDLTGEATFNVISVDGKVFFNTASRVQPHVLVGLAFPWLTVIDGSFDGDLVGDGRFRGQGLNLEGGLTAFLTPSIGVSAGYLYRVIWFNRANGVSDTPYRLRPRFRETSGALNVMAFVTF